MKKNFSYSRAFSLLELSFSIVIISIIFIGIASGTKIIKSLRLKSAQNLTQNSPVNTIDGLILWLEPTMPDSFIASQAKDGTQLTSWYDRNPQANNKYYANAGTGVTYKEQSEIYSLPSVKFNAASTSVKFNLSTTTSSSGNTRILTPYNAFTFFAVAKLDPAYSGTLALFCNGSSGGWGYAVSGSAAAGGTRQLYFPGSGTTSVSVTTANATSNPEIISATYANNSLSSSITSVGSVRLFTNGVGSAGNGDDGSSETLTASSSVIVRLPVGTGFFIGSDLNSDMWNGYISELIVFNRALSDGERRSVEKYLAQKYGIKIKF